MAVKRMKLAELNQSQLQKLQAFEEELGAYVVALEPQYALADLSADQVHKLQRLERELGVVLLAYEKD